MARSKTSAAWMQEHVSDEFVKRAKAEGYRSRAAYKLLEIDAQDRLIRPGMTVVDLGCSPGGWAQVATSKVGLTGRVIGLDLLEVEPLPGLVFIQGDFRDDQVLAELISLLGGAAVDLVLSDMAPNISGIPSADQARAEYLGELALDFAREWLKPGGALLVKTFHGGGFDELRAAARSDFTKVDVRKPKASRSRSSEVFLLCRGRRP